jgi:hypothetical protein
MVSQSQELARAHVWVHSVHVGWREAHVLHTQGGRVRLLE